MVGTLLHRSHADRPALGGPCSTRTRTHLSSCGWALLSAPTAHAYVVTWWLHAQVRKAVDGQAAVLGFVGAPFTLASYIVEGGSSKDFHNLKRLAFGSPEVRAVQTMLKRQQGGFACTCSSNSRGGAWYDRPPCLVRSGGERRARLHKQWQLARPLPPAHANLTLLPAILVVCPGMEFTGAGAAALGV